MFDQNLKDKKHGMHLNITLGSGLQKTGSGDGSGVDYQVPLHGGKDGKFCISALGVQQNRVGGGWRSQIISA